MLANFERKDIVDDYHTHAAAGVARRLVDRHVVQHGFAPVAELAQLRVFRGRTSVVGDTHTHTDNDRWEAWQPQVKFDTLTLSAPPAA